MPNEKKTITQIKRTLESVVGNELIPGRDENGDFKIEISKLLLGFENYISETPEPEKVPRSDESGKLDIGWFDATETPAQNSIPKSGSNSLLQNGWLADDIRGYEHTVDPVAYYTEHTQDYELKVGEVAKITFDVTASPYNVPLRIKTMANTYYSMELIVDNNAERTGGSTNATYLLPNNTTENLKFFISYVDKAYNLTLEGNSFNGNSFRIGILGYSTGHFYLHNVTNHKSIIGQTDIFGTTYSYPVASIISTVWQNHTTEWTSLGTVQFGQATKGTILIRRLL